VDLSGITLTVTDAIIDVAEMEDSPATSALARSAAINDVLYF
jgi:hypothetical protein